MLASGNKVNSSSTVPDLYLWKDGDQCTDVTNGWSTWYEGNGNSYTADIRDNSFYVGGTGNGRKGWKINKELSQEIMSKYNYVFFQYKGTSYSASNGGNCEFYGDTSQYGVDNKVNRDVIRVIGLPLHQTTIKFSLQMNGSSTSYMWVYKVWLGNVGD